MPETPKNINASITPLEFELLVKDYLQNLGQNLTSFVATHDVRYLASDGEYQIDVFCNFEALGATFKVLVECKKQKRDVERAVVQLLFDKLRATGSQKGLIFSTGGFQSGAIEFAEMHGIALIRLIEGRYTYFTKAGDEQKFDPPPWADISKYVGEYVVGSSYRYLDHDSLNSLEEFLFG
jgi:restriction system protein